MSHNELRSEIIKRIDNIPDSILEEILAVMKRTEAKKTAFTDDELLDKIFAEDKQLLQRLAL